MKLKLVGITVAALAALTGVATAQTEDTAPPSITMETPVNGVEITTDRVTVSGEATDNVGVKEVQYRLEGQRRWRRAQLTNPDETTTTWVFSFKNSKKGRARRAFVRAVDRAKNESDIIGRKFRRSRTTQRF